MLHKVFKRARNSLLSFLPVILLLGLMSACGLRGDLYLPDQRPQPASNKPTQPATENPEQTKSEQDKKDQDNKDQDKQTQDQNATATDSSGTTDDSEMK